MHWGEDGSDRGKVGKSGWILREGIKGRVEDDLQVCIDNDAGKGDKRLKPIQAEAAHTEEHDAHLEYAGLIEG